MVAPHIKTTSIACPPVNKGYGIYKLNEMEIYKGMW